MKRFFVLLIVGSMLFSFIPMTANAYTSDIKIGAWVGTEPSASEVDNFQKIQGKKLDITHLFINWSTSFSSVKTYADVAASNGSTLLVTWEPWEYNTVDISGGKADSYITRMAADMKSYNKEIWLRPLHEANGDWYPWAIGNKTGVNTNDTYKAAFRHIVDIFRDQGATNVKFIFNVNCSNVGNNSSFLGHYPGDNYVDYNSIDGYNWGTTQSWGSKWQNFNEIFSSAYNSINTINKPIIIAEWASTEIGGNKAQWITDSFNTINSSYKNIMALVWFSHNKETDWRINSSTSSLEAYRKAIGVTNVTPTVTTTPTLTPTKVPTFTPTPTSGLNIIYGDVSGDGKVDSADYTLLRKYLLRIINTLPANDWKIAADVNKDNVIDSADYTLLRKYLLRQIVALPVN